MPKNDLTTSSKRLLGVAAIFAASGAFTLMYILWSYVPSHVRHFAEAEVSLPAVTRMAIALSESILPALLLAGVLALGVGAVVLALVGRGASTDMMVHLASLGAVLVALVELVACVAIVFAIHAAY